MGNYNNCAVLSQARPDMTVEITRVALTEAEERTERMMIEGYHPGNEAIEMLDELTRLRSQIQVLVDERGLLIQDRLDAQDAAKKATKQLETAMAVIAEYQETMSRLAARRH